MKILFAILLGFPFLISFSQNDSIKHKFSVGISPLLFLYPNEDGLYIEYQPNQKISFELGGGVFNLIKHPLNNYGGTGGFTIRLGVKLYLKTKEISATYLEVLCFYRQIQYRDQYFWFGDPFIETGIGFGGDPKKSIRGDNLKNVICLQGIWGYKYFLGEEKLWAIEPYIGFGGRVNIRNFNATSEYDYGLPTIYYSPPKQKLVTTLSVSPQGGIKFAHSL